MSQGRGEAMERNFIPWIERLWRIPPFGFWPVFLRFLGYAWRQGWHAVARRRTDRHLQSHINFKRAHYLEKAMLCQYDRSPELDANYAGLQAYLETPMGIEDPCYLYLRKLEQEYKYYPSGFRCYMRDIGHKPRPDADARVLRRVIVQRRSVRHFSPDAVSPDELKAVVEAGSYAPTSCNAQALQFLTLHDRAMIDQVFGAASGAASWRHDIPAALLVMTDRRHYKPFEQHGVMLQDIAAATQNCLLMAEATGFAACWVSLISDMHIVGQATIYERLGLPDHLLIGAAIAIGRPASSVCLVPRRPLHSVWHADRWGNPAGTP